MPVIYGESSCQATYASGAKEGQQCQNKAFYIQGTKYLCGTHSKPSLRRKLPKDPDANEKQENELARQKDAIKSAKLRNKAVGQPGDVICSTLGLRKRPEDHEGYLKVFPNYLHQNRKDGFGCAALSPGFLGPVQHRQKGLPEAKNLENYYQFNKVYSFEVGKDTNPSAAFLNRLDKAYTDGAPHRHKFGKQEQAKYGSLKLSHFMHKDADGELKKYSDIQSRYFYCHFYEKLASKEADYKQLKKMIREGTNIQLVGYDGYPVTKNLSQHYADPARPFAHEMVLYTMLVMKDPKDYPWNKYYMKHNALYPEYLAPSQVEYYDSDDSDNGSDDDDDSDNNDGDNDNEDDND